ncbi:DnaJ domain-containing protein [Opitutales bacterium]|nr:DnaJ domain-containing protein [Opitutales bacterium]MDA8991001.1 DnaJ domain-containing protein [Opitutales bacterium]
MNWWGKLIGTGVGMLGGPIGALAGAAIGHLYDDDDPTPQSEKKARILYFAYFFSCAAKIAKADGSISVKEIEATENIMRRMNLNEETRKFAKNIFRKAKTNNRSIDLDLKEAACLINYDQAISLSFIGGLFEIANSNSGKPNELQLRYLMRAAERLKIDLSIINAWLKNGYSPPHQDGYSSTFSLEEAFQLFDLEVSATDVAIKKAYHRKAANFHPDKLKSKDLPDEFTNFANAELAKINLAYDIIRKTRSNLK